MIKLALLLACCLGAVLGTNSSDGLAVRIVSGAFTRKLDDILVYSITAPIVYDIQFNLTEIQPATFMEQGCSDSRQAECQIINSVEKILLATEKRMVNLQESLRATPFGSSALQPREGRRRRSNVISDGIGSFFSFCCSVATQMDLDSMFTTQSNMKAVFDKLKTAVIADHSNIIVMKKAYKDFTLNVTGALTQYQTAMKKIVERTEAFQAQSDKNMDWLTLFHNKMTLLVYQITQGLMKITDIMHYNDLVQHCRSRLIPLSAVPIGDLKTDLQALQKEVRKHGYQLVINPGDAVKYYNYPLAKCVFADDKIMITGKAPLRKQKEIFSLHQLVNIPFIYNNEVCTIDHSPTLLAATEQDVITIQGTALETCKPSEGICYVSQFESDPQEGSRCATLILQGAPVSQLKESCPFTCRKRVKDSHFVTQLDFHRFILTGHPEGTTLICEKNDTSKPTPIPTNDIGCTEVLVPCSCFIRIPGRNRVIRSPYPCPESNTRRAIIHRLIPAAWGKIDIPVLSEAAMSRAYQHNLNAYSFQDVKEILNTSWTLDSTLNITEIEDLLHIQLPDIVHKLPTISSFLLYLWNVPLTVAVLYLLIRVCQPNLPFMGTTLAMAPLLQPAQGVEAKLTPSAHQYYIGIYIAIYMF